MTSKNTNFKMQQHISLVKYPYLDTMIFVLLLGKKYDLLKSEKPFLTGLAKDRSLHGDPPITKSIGLISFNCNKNRTLQIITCNNT